MHGTAFALTQPMQDRLASAADAHDMGASAMRSPMVMMAVEHYAGYRWVQAPVSALALWLLTSPFVLGFSGAGQMWSDVISGAATLCLSLFALKPRRGLVSWLVSLVGLWLLLAPLLFWTAEPAAYANDTLVGALLIGFGLLIPMGMEMKGPAVPPGWSYNPSAWSQRAPIIALSFVSFLAARYMAAYQLGHIHSVWDPFFGDGTERVLTSKVSRAWPVSDAGLGASTYLIEVLMGLMGDKRRWRTMPWMVAGFGLVVVPLGVVSITLVMLQPVMVGAWCALCLFTAAAMLLMIPLALDEIVAMVQLVVHQKKNGASAWRVFWLGANLPDDTRSGHPTRHESWRPNGMFWGVTGTWSLWLSTALGVWLLFAPHVFGVDIQAAAADSEHIAGALIIVVAVVALAEVARPLRLLNIPVGIWLMASPWFLDGGSRASHTASALAGLAALLLSLPLGKLRDHYGTFDSSLLWPARATRSTRTVTQ